MKVENQLKKKIVPPAYNRNGSFEMMDYRTKTLIQSKMISDIQKMKSHSKLSTFSTTYDHSISKD